MGGNGASRALLRSSVLLALWLSLAPAAETVAGGPIHGAKAAGMGTAFVGVADDPSAILHNPGGLTQSAGTQAYGGVTAVYVRSEFEDEAGESESTDFQLFYPPHLYLTSDLGTRRWVLGLGFHSPFGIGGRKWDKDGLTRYGSTESGIATFAVNPTVAWQVHPALSLALGVDYLWARSQTERMVDQSPLGAGDGEFRLKGDGHGWGYNLGLLWRVGPSVRVGFAYRSRIEVDIEGDAKLSGIAPALQPLFGGARFETDAKTTLRFPEIYGLGIALDPAPRWTLALDVEVVCWSSFDETTVDFETEVPEAGFVDGTTRLGWKDSWQLKAGADWRPTEGVSLRGGYAYVPAAVPASTLEPGNPDANQHNFSVGAGCRSGRVVLDGFYNLGVFEARKVRNDVLSGEYWNRTHLLGVSLGYRL